MFTDFCTARLAPNKNKLSVDRRRDCRWLCGQPICKPFSRNRSIDRSFIQSVSQSLNRSTIKPSNRSIDQSVSQSVNQLVNHVFRAIKQITSLKKEEAKTIRIFQTIFIYVTTLVRPTNTPDLSEINSKVAPPHIGEISRFCDFCSPFLYFFRFLISPTGRDSRPIRTFYGSNDVFCIVPVPF